MIAFYIVHKYSFLSDLMLIQALDCLDQEMGLKWNYQSQILQLNLLISGPGCDG